MSHVNLPVHLERGLSGASLTRQLVDELRRRILRDELKAGLRLPSTRRFALELEVSRTVVSEAYSILVADGFLEGRVGSGTFVCRAPKHRPTPRRHAQSSRWLRNHPEPDIDPPIGTAPETFRVCEPDGTTFPDAAWRTCARAAIRESLPLGYGDAAGDPDLRRSIATLLLQERGFSCSPEDVIVTTGTTQSLDLVARAVLRAGDPVAFEDPGYRLGRQILAESGAELRPVAVDTEGLRVSELSRGSAPLAVYVTPSHQFPTGVPLSYRRRVELLDWARQHDALLLEDDYDSEFRLDGPALPTLASQDASGRVVYLGTFSKSLAPSLRLGFLVAPEALRTQLLRLKLRRDHHTSWPLQRTVARFIRCGAFGRHLRRMRRMYRSRRDRLVHELTPLPRGAAWIGLAAGLHATLRLPDDLPARLVAADCSAHGIRIRTLADDSVSASPSNGLVLGYGSADEADLARGGATLRRSLARVAAGKVSLASEP
ncbi:MAG: PLP-dependent aminotransferase family protein [Thermoanaerobaculia bacterium]|nr:PLP-dependent aminotransferase family protein [Thermoanaerobaculia bacterium]